MILNAQVSTHRLGRPTLVLVHGVAGSLHIWDPVYEALARDHTVVRLDLLGYGHSPRPRGKYTPERHAAVIRGTLQALNLDPPYVFVGLSMGATLVLEYACRYPADVTGLVMIGYPYYEDRAQAKAGLRHNLWAGLTINHPVFARVFVPAAWGLGRVGILPPRLFAGIYTRLQARETLLAPYRVFRENVWGCMVKVDHGALLDASAALPRLVIHGSEDEWSPAARVEKAVASYSATKFTQVDDTGHNIVVLKPQAVLDALNYFLGHAT